MLDLLMFFKRLLGKFKSSPISLRDTAAKIDVGRAYNLYQDWAARHPKTAHDVEAPRHNANVAIATRAISDAIMGLPPQIIIMEQMGGVEREIPDPEHIANELVLNPNPRHSWSEVVQHLTKSYLNDGNGYATIEVNTGPNKRLEIWPRDPRTVIQSKDKKSYEVAYGNLKKQFPANRVIHIRDISPDDPFYGTSRIESVRKEIEMDYHINQFNNGFFVNGAILNVMFTPEHDLTEVQHQQILDAMNAEISGSDNAFKIFINRYSGKFETTDQKHDDISFLSLLEHNREKIFGVFGLPPFRGGVMQYANYANALAQDLDFWINTVKPIIIVIENAFNKQLLWPLYGTEIRLKLDLNVVPAIRGTRTEQIERLLKLKQSGIVSGSYVREQLGITEDAAPAEPVIPVQPDSEDDSDGENRNGGSGSDPNNPNGTEQKNMTIAIYRYLKEQRDSVTQKLDGLTANGMVLSVLCDPDKQALKLFDLTQANSSLSSHVIPELKTALMNRQIGVNTTKSQAILWFAQERLQRFNAHIVECVQTYLADADRYSWSYEQLKKRLRSLFTFDRAESLSLILLFDSIPKAEVSVVRQQKPKLTESASEIQELIKQLQEKGPVYDR